MKTVRPGPNEPFNFYPDLADTGGISAKKEFIPIIINSSALKLIRISIILGAAGNFYIEAPVKKSGQPR